MKPVLIIENSNNGLKLNESSKIKDKYILTGEFTAFGVRNRNERVYTAEDFVPHLESMMSKREWGVIYGEFDHPDSFDVSMKYVSHTIESAVYNKDRNAVDGEIRLLNTTYGKDAKAIVDDGLPLFVSSRAAGITESNGSVKLKQLFTYDIVADPGFSSARMSIKTINESLGIKSNNKAIIEASKEQLSLLNEKYERSNQLVFDFTNTTDTNKFFEMNKNDMVTKKEFSRYSKHLISEINMNNAKIMKKITESKGAYKGSSEVQKLIEYNNTLETTLKQVISYLNYLAEKVSFGYEATKKLENKSDKLVKYTNYLGENLNKNIEYSNYLAENLDANISYGEYIAEGLNKNINYSNYLAENLDKSIDYSMYIAENLDKNITYSNYLAENLDANIAYSEYISENLSNGIEYMQYIAENLDTNIAYTQYVGENLETSLNYSDYLSECIDKTLDYSNMIAEKLNANKGKSINESIQLADEYLKVTEKCKTKEEEEITSKEVEGTIEEEEEECTQEEESEIETIASKINIEAKKESAKKVSEKVNGIIKDENSTENLSSKIDNLIKEAKLRKASEVQTPNFYEFLKPDDIKAYESLTREEREEIAVALNESVGYYSRHDVLSVWKNVLENKNTISDEEKLIASMPEDIKPLWEKCDANTKKSLFAQSKLYDITNEASIEHFWETRNFKHIKEGNKTLLESANPFANYGKLTEDEIKAFEDKFNSLNQ